MKIHFLCKWWLFCKEFIRFTFIFIFLFIFISFSLIFIRKFCKFYKKTYFIKKYKRHFIVKWKNHSVMKSFRFSQQSKSSFLYIISHNQKLLSSPHWNLSLCINLIIPFSFSPLKLISPAGLRFRSARCARGVYVYPKFGHIVLRSMIIIPEFRAQKSRPFSSWCCVHRSSIAENCERRSTIPLWHDVCARVHIYRDTLLSFMILYRFLFVLQLLVPLHVSRLAPIKAAPVAIGIKRSIHESTLFRARLQDLLMVMGARVPVGSRASRSCGDYLRWLFEGQ